MNTYLAVFTGLLCCLQYSAISASSEPLQKPEIKLDKNIVVLPTENDNSLLFTDGKENILVTSIHNLDYTDIEKISSGSQLKFIIFTHSHDDENKKLDLFADIKSTLVFQENSFNRLSDIKSSSVLTIGNRLAIKTKDEEIWLIHFPGAHTDGDLAVYFKNANLLYTGNLFYPDSFPLIDIEAGGSVRGYLDAVNELLKISDKKTVIIPGRGSVSDKKTLENFQKMFKNSKNRIELLTHADKSLKEILNENPLNDFIDTWENGGISATDFIENLYNGIKKKN